MDIEETSTLAPQPGEPVSEYRFDPLTGRWTIIAEGRGARPDAVSQSHPQPTADRNERAQEFQCRFCPGMEQYTTPTLELASLKEGRRPNTTDPDDFEIIRRSPAGLLERDPKLPWSVRVIDNLYPAFVPPAPGHDYGSHALEASCFRMKETSAVEEQGSRLFSTRVPALGRHEVIIDTPRCVRGWAEMTDVEIKLTFRVFKSRLNAMRDDGRLSYAFVFKNVGRNAGASQPHSHCQLTGNVALPPEIEQQILRLADYERKRLERGEPDDYWTALLRAELADGSRVVRETERFVLRCPFASRFPAEVEICPKFDGDLLDYSNSALDELALLARDAVRALQRGKERFMPNDPRPLDYNVIMRAVPFKAPESVSDVRLPMRPRWSFLPSLVKKAGYELGCGLDINPLAPETAARILRDVF